MNDYENYANKYDKCSITAWKFLDTLVKVGILTRNDYLSIRVGHVVKFVNRYVIWS